MQSTAQGWLVYQLTGSKVLLGTVAAVGTLPMLLLSLWGGSVADRHSKRTVVFYTQTGMMLTAFVFAALVGSGHIQIWEILVLAALGGVAMAFDMPARQAFMVEMTSHEDLMNAISLNSSIVNGARVVGPAVAGFLMARVGMAWCFLLNGVSFIAVIVGLLMMRLPKFVPPQRPHSTGRHILEGFRYVAGHRRVRILMLLFAVVGVFGWSYAGAAARLRDGHLACRRERLWRPAQRQRLRSAFGRADGGHLGQPRPAPAPDPRRAVVVLGHAGGCWPSCAGIRWRWCAWRWAAGECCCISRRPTP